MSEPTRPGRPSRWHGEAGFTLSELLLVSVFVVGLVLVAVTSARNIEADTSRSNCETELRNLKMAVAQYQSKRDRYPSSIEDLVRAGVVDAEAVDRWIVTGGGGDQPPTYRPDLTRC